MELIVENNPNTILIVDKGLVASEVIVAKDEFSHQLQRIIVGKYPEDLFTDKKTLSDCAHCRKAIEKAIEEQVSVDISYEICYDGKVYYYSSKVQPYKDDLGL